jgi:hypothetical protein
MRPFTEFLADLARLAARKLEAVQGKPGPASEPERCEERADRQASAVLQGLRGEDAQ